MRWKNLPVDYEGRQIPSPITDNLHGSPSSLFSLSSRSLSLYELFSLLAFALARFYRRSNFFKKTLSEFPTKKTLMEIPSEISLEISGESDDPLSDAFFVGDGYHFCSNLCNCAKEVGSILTWALYKLHKLLRTYSVRICLSELKHIEESSYHINTSIPSNQ